MMAPSPSEPEEDDLATWGLARIKEAANHITESIDVPTLLLMQAAFVLGMQLESFVTFSFRILNPPGLMLKDFSFGASSFVSKLFSEATSEDEKPVSTRTSSTTPLPKLTQASPTPLPLFSPIHPKSREIQPRVELLYDQIEVEC